MYGVLFFLFLFLFVLSYLNRKYSNPYKLIFLFGKKGAGKSCYMVKLMLRYLKKGWHIYTDMSDINIPDVRIISSSDLANFRPEEHSVIFLDEVGISMDNRNFKSFPPGLRDFFKYIRKMECIVYMNSQAFDVDKKVRDTTDSMGLLVCLFGFLSLYRPISRVVTLVDATSQGESRIADNLRFRSVFSWRITYMPRYFKYFNSKEMPARPYLPYIIPLDTIDLSYFSLKESIKHVYSKAATYFRNR